MNAKVLGISLLLVALCGFLAIYTPESFLKGNNIENLIRRTSMYGILGIGVAFVIISAGIDLSIGSLVCLSACLLAIFLDVQYIPFEGAEIRSLSAVKQTIVVETSDATFSPGDGLRYYGGRRAKNALLTIKSVESKGDSVSIVVNETLSRDDTVGKIAKRIELVSLERVEANTSESNHPTITLRGHHGGLAPRDQIWLVGNGLKRLTILQVDAQPEKTVLSVDGSLGKVDETWSAIPLERRQRFSVPIALAMVLGIAVLLGAIHGILVTSVKLQPFVVTLCGLLIYRGMTRWMVDDRTMGFGNEYNETLTKLGTGELPLWQASDGSDSFGIPYPFFVMIACAIGASLFLNKTVWGRYLLALGCNEDAARYSGINTRRMTSIAYVICALMAAIGGILFALDSNSVAPSSFGNFFELYAIAAAVLGGCSLRGGEGGILGVIVGTALMQTLYNLIVLVGISDKLEFAIIGAVILAGVVADELVRRTAARKRATKSASSS